MATEIIMPKVDMVMETGTFVEWLKKEGEAIQKGEALFVIMTDKAAIAVEAPESGILAGLSARPDDVIPVTQVIGYLLRPGEALPEAPAGREPAPQPQEAEALERIPTQPQVVETNGKSGGAIRATPLARSRAQELKLELSGIPGSGPRGRIYRADVERYLADAQAAASARPAEPAAQPLAALSKPPIALPPARESRRIPLKGARAVIAQRLSYSAATIPHIHISLQVDMSEAARLREKVNPMHEKQHGRGISYTAIIAHAAARLLKKHPLINSSLYEDEIILWDDVHLGIATNLDDNLVVPVIRQAQAKQLDEIAAEISRLVESARAKKLAPSEMTGSTFTLSNLGMLGAVSFTAIINPPETGILAVGKIVDTPVAVGKEVAIRPLMTMTLAVDHRVVDGAQATLFLRDLKETLENPYLLL